MTTLWNTFHNLFIPSQANAYRPRVLHRSWLVFFLALMLAAEGFLMTNLASRQSDEAFLASVAVAGSTPMEAPSSLEASPASAFRTFVQQVVRILGNPEVVNPLLGGVATMLVIALVLTFFIHIQIQPRDMLAGGAVAVGLALLFIYSNNHFLLSTDQASVSQVEASSQAQMAEAAASL